MSIGSREDEAPARLCRRGLALVPQESWVLIICPSVGNRANLSSDATPATHAGPERRLLSNLHATGLAASGDRRGLAAAIAGAYRDPHPPRHGS